MNLPFMNNRSFASRLWPLVGFPSKLVRQGGKEILVRLLRKIAFLCYWNGDYSYAEMAYDAILRLRPRDAFSTAMRVELLERLGDSGECALAIVEDYLSEFPDSVGAHLKMSHLFLRNREPERAKKELDIASSLSPNSIEVILSNADFHRHNGKLDESSEILESVTSDGECETALYLLAVNMIDAGDRVGAIKLLERAIESAPNFAPAYAALAGCRYYDIPSHPHIVHMKKTVEEGMRPAILLSQFHFALGEAFDGMGFPDVAFAHFKAGNELSPRTRNPTAKEIARFVNLQIRTFDQRFLEALQISCNRELVGKSLIFVVGMPRSGTTLVEQILASHPEVYGGGETNDIIDVKYELWLRAAGQWPRCLANVDRNVVCDIVRNYASRLTSESYGHPYIVDKSLGNCFEIGFLLSLFPWCKIIYCRRNPLDSCLSCYFKNLAYVAYSRDLKSIGLIYAEHERIMDHWHSLFGSRILDLDYEDLVDQPDVQIRRLLEYCGLSWHDNCLNPERTKRVVLTASASQVKVPINKHSVGRWKKYRQYLGPLLEGLAGSPRTGFKTSVDLTVVDVA